MSPASLPLDEALALVIHWLWAGADTDAKKADVERLLEPPNKIDPATGMPFGWGDEEDDWVQWDAASRTR